MSSIRLYLGKAERGQGCWDDRIVGLELCTGSKLQLTFKMPISSAKMSELLAAERQWWLASLLSAIVVGILAYFDLLDDALIVGGWLCSRHYHVCVMLVGIPALVWYSVREAQRSSKAHADVEGVDKHTATSDETAAVNLDVPMLPAGSPEVQPDLCTETQESFRDEQSPKHVSETVLAAVQAVCTPGIQGQSGQQYPAWDEGSDCTPDCQSPERALPQVPCLDPGLPETHLDGETLRCMSVPKCELAEGQGQDEVLSTAPYASLGMLDAKLSEGTSQLPEDVLQTTPDDSHDFHGSLPPDEQTLPCAPRHNPGLPSTEVLVNIYDVSQDPTVQRLNELLAHRYIPFKFGGIFHAGVEMFGQEWSFGFVACGTGVHQSPPRNHPHHHFRETIRLGPTALSHEEVLTLINAMSSEYPGDSYHLCKRNCCHFASDVCLRLGVGELPYWIQRLASIGDSVLSVSQDLEKSIAGLRLSRSNALRHNLTSRSDMAQS